MAGKIAFISGHLDLTQEEFEKHYVPMLDHALVLRDEFVVGDAVGADLYARHYLSDKTLFVKVYHMFTQPRNNPCNYLTIPGFNSDKQRDEAMTNASDYDIAWVRPGREKSGTQKNINRRGCIS